MAIFKVLAPDLGQSNSNITVEQWFKNEGDHIEKGEALFEMSNMKLNQEVESSVSGTIVKIYVEEGDEAAPTTLLAEIQED